MRMKNQIEILERNFKKAQEDNSSMLKEKEQLRTWPTALTSTSKRISRTRAIWKIISIKDMMPKHNTWTRWGWNHEVTVAGVVVTK